MRSLARAHLHIDTYPAKIRLSKPQTQSPSRHSNAPGPGALHRVLREQARSGCGESIVEELRHNVRLSHNDVTYSDARNLPGGVDILFVVLLDRDQVGVRLACPTRERLP